MKSSACTGCHTRLTPSPNGPFFLTYPIYELCSGVEDKSKPQRDEPGSKGEATRRLFGGPRLPVRDGCILSLRQLGTC